jgi:hypothetical protein
MSAPHPDMHGHSDRDGSEDPLHVHWVDAVHEAGMCIQNRLKMWERTYAWGGCRVSSTP